MPQTTDQMQADLTWAVAQFGTERYKTLYPRYRNYYNGVQDLTFATPKFTATFGQLFTEFAYNRCGSVVDSVADRLYLKGFTDSSRGVVTENTTLRDQIELIWRLNQMDRKQGELFTESLKMGDAYLIVWPEPTDDPNAAGMVPKMYVNDADLIVIRYNDDTKAKIVAIKAWRDADKFWHVNFYYPDATWKYKSVSKPDDLPKDLKNFALDSPDPALVAEGLAVQEPNPLPNPYNKIPVFHFANNSRQGSYGISELSSVLPLQDALNKACTDLMVAMEFGAFPQRWATGLQMGLPDPATGKVRNPFKDGPGNIFIGNAGAAFGNFDATPLAQFIEVQDSFDKKISNVSRIPTHWLNMGQGDTPSGEALKTAEAPFVAKIKDRQRDSGQDFEDAFTFALETMGVTGVSITPQWESAELRSETDMLAAAMQKKQLGWSTVQIQRELGLDETVIEQMQQENADAVAEQQRQFSAGLNASIPAGGGNTPPTNSAPLNRLKAAQGS